MAIDVQPTSCTTRCEKLGIFALAVGIAIASLFSHEPRFETSLRFAVFASFRPN